MFLERQWNREQRPWLSVLRPKLWLTGCRTPVVESLGACRRRRSSRALGRERCSGSWKGARLSVLTPSENSAALGSLVSSRYAQLCLALEARRFNSTCQTPSGFSSKHGQRARSRRLRVRLPSVQKPRWSGGSSPALVDSFLERLIVVCCPRHGGPGQVCVGLGLWRGVVPRRSTISPRTSQAKRKPAVQRTFYGAPVRPAVASRLLSSYSPYAVSKYVERKRLQALRAGT